jgi:hypothetical protein
MEQKITPELATDEINKWLDSKKVGSKKRESQSIAIETLAYGMVDGDIYVNADGDIVQKLKFPENLGDIKELVYKKRISANEIEQKQSAAKNINSISLSVVYASALTGVAVGLLKKLDTEDLNLVSAVAVFFM